MTGYLGDFAVNSIVRIPWNTNAGDGSSITIATNGAIKIYKGSSTTERTSSSGVSELEDHDTDTGTHLTIADTSDNADAGFYASGSEFFVKRTGMTIDGKTVSHWIGSFSIERYGNVYGARVWMIDDNGGTTDRYVVAFLKNGQPILAGITSPTVQTIKASDGTDLVAATALTQIAATGLYKYDEATNRIVSGQSYVVKIQATIDAGTRTMTQPLGRDT